MSANDIGAVLKALAQVMHDKGVATYSPTAPYVESDLRSPAVVFGELNPSPVWAVALCHYGTDPDVDTVEGSPLHRVTLAWRSPKTDPISGVYADAKRGFDALHTLTPGPWPGGVDPQWMLRTISGQAERDNGRWIVPDSYDIRLN